MPNDLTPTASLDPTATVPLGRPDDPDDHRVDEVTGGDETTLSAAMRRSLARSGGLTDQPAVLAALGVADVPAFAALAAVTLVAARRAITTTSTPTVA